MYDFNQTGVDHASRAAVMDRTSLVKAKRRINKIEQFDGILILMGMILQNGVPRNAV